MQVASPLHFMGTIFREVDESHANVEELFNILKMRSRVEEPLNAVAYKPEGGEVEFRGINYEYMRDDNQPE